MSSFNEARNIKRDPVTAITGLAAIGGAILEAKGRRDQAKAAREEGREEAALRARDADVELERTRRLRATQRARFGAAGVAVGSGSSQALGIQAFSDLILNQQRILTGANLVKRSSRNRAKALETDAFGALLGGAIDTGTLYQRTRDE